MAAAACQLQVDGEGVIRRAALGLGGVDGTPLAFPDLAQQLVGQRMSPALARDIANQAASRCEPGSDMHADSEYRRHLATVLMTRILQKTGQAPAAAKAA